MELHPIHKVVQNYHLLEPALPLILTVALVPGCPELLTTVKPEASPTKPLEMFEMFLRLIGSVSIVTALPVYLFLSYHRIQ